MIPWPPFPSSPWRPGPLLAALAAVLLVACAEQPGPAQIQVYTAPVPIGADALAGRHGLAGAHVGFVLEDLDTGERLAEANADRAFIPASTAKLATFVSALGILGPDYRFETRLLASGRLSGGTLDGDLFLQGTGDPLLQAQDLMGLAGQLRDAGVTRVAGGFLYDERFLDRASVINPSQPAHAQYNPGLSALSLDFNRTLLNWRPKGTDGGSEAFETPAFADMIPGLSATEPGAGRIAVYGGPDAESRWLLSPSLPPRGDVFVPVKDPGLRTARVFRRLCKWLGIEMKEPAPARHVPEDAAVVASIGSLALIDVTRLGFEHSNNLVAELTGQVAARRLSGRPQTLSDGAATLTGWLHRQIPGVDWAGFGLANHSGLDAGARASPAQMAAIVRFAASKRFGGWRLEALLPAGGMRDAMRGRFRDPTTALRVWAKTGTLKYATGLAGIFMSQQGRRVAFALFATDFDRRKGYDAAANPDDPAVARPAEDWIGRAEAFGEDLVREWVLQF